MKYATPRTSDAELFERLLQFYETASSPEGPLGDNLEFSICRLIAPHVQSIDARSPLPETGYRPSGEHAIFEGQIQIRHQNQQNHTLLIDVKRDGTYTDSVVFTPKSLRVNAQTFELLEDIWPRLKVPVEKLEAQEDEVSEVLQVYHGVMGDMRQLQQSLLNSLHEKAADLEKQNADTLRDLRNDLLTEFEDRKKELESSLATRREALDEREQQLNEREESLNLAASKDARRKERDEILSLVQERVQKMSFSEGTVKFRWPVYIIAGLLCVASIVAMIIALFTRDLMTLDGVLAFSLPFLGIVSISIFLLRFATHEYARIKEEELKTRAFGLDFNRATWLIELLHEWHVDNPEKDLPPGLVQTLGRGLFMGVDAVEATEHPAVSALAHVLGESSALKLKVPGAEAEYDRKAMKRMRED